jgi:hypothetical protein
MDVTKHRHRDSRPCRPVETSETRDESGNEDPGLGDDDALHEVDSIALEEPVATRNERGDPAMADVFAGEDGEGRSDVEIVDLMPSR